MADGNVAGRTLASLVEGYELLERQRAELEADLKTLIGEVRSNGFDVAAFKALIRKRRSDAAAAGEQDQLVELYARAVADAARAAV